MSDKPMTLAEAIKLGATYMKPLEGDFHTARWAKGCAIGMAMFAHGKITTEQLRKLHPILDAKVSKSFGKYSYDWPLLSHITGQFDNEVMSKKGKARQRLFDVLIEQIATREREFEARRAAKASAQPTTKAADASRETVTTPVKPHA